MTALSHSSLEDYYITNFELKEYRGGGVWDLDEIEGMFPFERELYITMTQQRVKERADAAQNEG